MQFGNTESNKWCAARGEPSQLVLLTVFFTFKQHLFNRLSFRIQFHRDIAAAKHAREQKILGAGTSVTKSLPLRGLCWQRIVED